MQRLSLLCFIGSVGILMSLAGCGGKFANIERPKGQIELRTPSAEVKEEMEVSVNPATASLSKSDVDVMIRYANPEELNKFFENEQIFGKLAQKNPYPDVVLVFYIKVFNHSTKKIKVNPDDFVMIDNLNIQYSELSADDISAIYDSNANVWSFAKTTGDLAPGPYGVPLKVLGTMREGGGRKTHYLIKQVRLGGGYVHPGIAYDGYIAFPRPHPNTASVRLVISGIKTDFNPADEPGTSIDFEFPLYLKTTVAKPKSNDGVKKP